MTQRPIVLPAQLESMQGMWGAPIVPHVKQACIRRRQQPAAPRVRLAGTQIIMNRNAWSVLPACTPRVVRPLVRYVWLGLTQGPQAHLDVRCVKRASIKLPLARPYATTATQADSSQARGKPAAATVRQAPTQAF